ncbi:hypothetical protein IMSHALPRED_009684 [Imshaugia aleurites]|uniref:Uncharacterized protein n=1 Tax=Imshaugia aleurites TaxID=172621 RepID=A0A8H3FY24_9LECA|nr:hypothetical protein IMSHALPRED_009684 [Imshaugia aleurites]
MPFLSLKHRFVVHEESLRINPSVKNSNNCQLKTGTKGRQPYLASYLTIQALPCFFRSPDRALVIVYETSKDQDFHCLKFGHDAGSQAVSPDNFRLKGDTGGKRLANGDAGSDVPPTW